MPEQGIFRIERLELYRTALEFSRIAQRIERALPIRKHETRLMLMRDSRDIADKIARGTAELSRQEAYSAYRLALRSTEQCHECLDRLHMVHMGGFADVTAGLEMLERLNAGLTQLINDARDHGTADTDDGLDQGMSRDPVDGLEDADQAAGGELESDNKSE